MHRTLRRLTAAVLVFALSGVTPAAAVTRLTAVAFSDANNGIIAGVNSDGPSHIGRTTDGGQSYQPKTFPAASVQDAWFISADIEGNQGIALTRYDQPVVSTDGGSTWTTASPVTGLSDVEFESAAILAGGRRAVVGKKRYTANGDIAVISTSDNAGATWQSRFEGPFYPAPDDLDPPRTRSTFTSIDAAPGGSVAWVVGSEARESGNSGLFSFTSALIKQSTDGGSTWVTQTPAGAPPKGLNAVAAGSTSIAYAAGPDRLFYRTTNGGMTWERQDIPTDNGSRTAPDMSAYAVDASGPVVVVAGHDGNTGKIAWSINGNAATPTWNYLDVPSPTQDPTAIRSVAVIDADSWLVVGDHETVARTDNAGATWTVTSNKPPAVNITGPADSFVLGSAPITFNGSALDGGSGVVSTEIRIRRADGQCFNGVTFAVGDRWLPVTTTNGYRTWSYTWGNNPDDPKTAAAGQLVTVEARATDAIGILGTSTAIRSDVPIVASVNIEGGAAYTATTTVPVSVSAPGATHMRWAVGTPPASSAAWSPIAGTAQVTLGAGEGVKTVYFEFSRNGSTVGGSASDSITLHTSVPAVAISSPSAGFSAVGTVTVSGTASDAGGTVSSVQVRIRNTNGQSWNGTAWAASDTWLPATSANGFASWSYAWKAPLLDQVVSITARATDMSGLSLTTSPLSSQLPDTPVVILDGGAAMTVDTTVSATVSAPGAAQMHYRVNGGTWTDWVPYATSTSVILPAGDGLKTVDFQFQNGTLLSASTSITLHTSLPTVSLTAPTQGFVATASPVTIGGTASDVGGTVQSVEVRVRRSDGRTWNGTAWANGDNWIQANTTTGYSVWSASWLPNAEFLASGDLVFIRARATDAAGLQTLSIERNSALPVTGQISLAGGELYAASAQVPVAIASSGASHMRWRVNGSQPTSWLPISNATTVALTAGDGTKTVEFDFSADGSTVAVTASDTIVRDSTAPTAAFTSPSAGFIYSSTPITISGTASDAVSGLSRVQVRLGQAGRYWSGNEIDGWVSQDTWHDASLTGGSWSYLWQPDPAGLLDGRPVTVDVRVIDAAGNAKSLSLTSAYHKTATTLALSTTSATLAYNTYGYVRGNLTVLGQPISGASVQLYSGSSSTRLVAGLKTTTDALGNFSFRVKPSSKTYYQVRYAESSTRLASNSGPAIALTPKVYLTTPSGPTSVSRTRNYTYSGYLKPRHTAGTYAVRIYVERRLSNGSYKVYRYYSAKASNYSSYSKYAGSVRLPYAGRWRIRAYHGDTGHAATYSSYRYVTSK